MESWQIILHIAASLDWDIQQVDVKTVSLYGLLPDDETQYMEQPVSFEEAGKEDWVWKLEWSLYGMKQSSHIWNQTLNDSMISWGFQHLIPDYCIYYQNQDGHIVITVVHVNDFLLVSSQKEENEAFKHQMHLKWELSDLGEAHLCVGIAIKQDRSTCSIYLLQTTLIDKLVAQFGQKDANPATIPMEPGLKL